MSLTHRRLETAGNFSEYHCLFQDCFPETKGTSLETEDHYQWKYGPGGKNAPAFEVAAYEDGHILGYYAALPFPYRMGERCARGVVVCDVMTSSAARGKGVFTAQGRYALSSMAESGIEFCTGYPIRPEVFPGHLKVGWQIAFPLPVYCKIVDPRPVFATRGAGWLGACLRPLAAAYHLGSTALRAGTGGATCRRLEPGEFFGTPDYARFYEKWAGSHPIHLVRTGEFYAWRLSAPDASYKVSAVYTRDSLLAGFAVTRRSAVHGIPVTAILDFLVLPEFRPLSGALHDDLRRLCFDNGSAGLTAMTTRPGARRWKLFANGYVKTNIQFKLILKWLAAGDAPKSLLDEEAWHLSWSDTDNL